jgi:hypothetical protein
MKITARPYDATEKSQKQMENIDRRDGKERESTFVVKERSLTSEELLRYLGSDSSQVLGTSVSTSV